jgi:hypothetical protein
MVPNTYVGCHSSFRAQWNGKKLKINSPFAKSSGIVTGALTILTGRHYKAIVVMITVFLIFLFFVKNTYSVSGCKNMQASILIVDESDDNQLSGSSVGALPDSPFKKYVTTISQHILPKIEEIDQCHGDLKNPPEVKLVFIYRPLVASTKSLIKEPFELKQPPDAFKYLDSPWAKLAISSSPKLLVNAMFVWSERQFLLDQAVLSDASIINPLLPITSDTGKAIEAYVFEQFLQSYIDSVLMAASPEAKNLAQANMAKRLPPEVYWLFSHAWQSTFAPFQMEVENALRATIQRGEVGYAELTNVLVDQFLSTTKPKVCYSSVVDMQEIFTTDKYKINQLH